MSKLGRKNATDVPVKRVSVSAFQSFGVPIHVCPNYSFSGMPMDPNFTYYMVPQLILPVCHHMCVSINFCDIHPVIGPMHINSLLFVLYNVV